MVNLNKKNVISFYSKLKKRSVDMFEEGNLEDALKNVSTAARLAYLFNYIFKDDDLERILMESSMKMLTGKKSEKFVNEDKKFVMIDSFGWANRGLSQQYLRGLISMNVDFLYISEYVSESKNEIYDEVRASGKGNLCLVPEGNNVEKIKFVYDTITEFSPSHILAHIFPWDVIATTVLYALPDVRKYNVNLTDHAFWLGAGCFNYTLEFREYGCTISVEKRGFKSSQVLLNPYYPIIDNVPFSGFPEAVENKTILFSGGNYYKIYGDNMIFLWMMKHILDNNNAVILFAGLGNDKKPLEEFIVKHKLEQRLILLGYRRDINQVFAHSDIYLGTYPFPGGLMTQYAAYNSKPVVAYSRDCSAINKVENIIFSKSLHTTDLTYVNLEEYYAEISRLINDKSYRISKGSLLKNALTTKEEFEACLGECLDGNRHLDFKMQEVNYEKRTEWYMDVNSTAVTDLIVELFIHYKIFAYFYFPKIMIKYTFPLIRFAFRSLVKLLK